MNDRINRLRKRLAQHETDAYFSVAPPLNQYLTGFRGTTSGVLVTMDRALFLCDFRYTEQAQSQVDGFDIEEVSGSMLEHMGERMSAWKAGAAAYEPGYMKVSALRGVEKKYKGRTEPVEDLVAGLKAVKEPGEVEAIRAALALSEGILTDMLVRLEPGMPEREAAALFEYEFKKRGASGASFDTIALFGPRSSLPHGAPGDTPLEPGDTVLFDFGCRLNGYCSDLTRTCCFATIPGPWFAEVYDLTLTAQRLAIEAARPGMGCRELDSVARKLIADAGHGEHFGHGLGHGVGIEIHESPRLNPHSDTVLEPGMVVTVEPGIYLPGRGGVRIEDVIVITEDGCEVLSTFPKELRILEA